MSLSTSLAANQPRHVSLHIGIKYGSGGEGRVFSELSKYLPSQGIDLIGAVAGPDNAAEMTNGRVLSFAAEGADMATRLLKARSTVIDMVRAAKPDLIASHFALYTAPALDRLKSLPQVTHFHGPWAAESQEEGSGRIVTALKKRVENYVYQNADRVIVLSKAFAGLAEQRYSIDPEIIRVVPGSVDISRFSLTTSRAASRLHLGLPNDRPILLSVRRLVQRMGLSRLIQAVEIISKVVPDVLLCIGGEGALRRSLEEQVEARSLQNHVRFLGYVKEADLPLLYRAADINVVPTLALEGFGLVAAEALAAGTPSLVTPIGGLPEVVAPLSSNLVFASSAVEDLASGLTAALRGTMKLPDQSACEAYARQNFTSTLMAVRTAEVYRELF